MTADERLALISVKIERAKKHVDDLNVAVCSFLDSKPYLVGAKRDPQTRRPIYYLTSVQSVPTTIAAIAGDVLHALRSALDHLAFSLVEVSGIALTTKERRDISFPILDTEDAAKYKSDRARKVKGMRPQAIKAI